MKILTIDLETTGLNPINDQILEIGMVFDDLTTKISTIKDLPTFHTYVWHPRIMGNPIALAMNADILKIIGKKDALQQPDVVGVSAAVEAMQEWLRSFYNLFGPGKTESITVTGKNVATFDIPFIQQLPCFKDSQIKFKHRVLDVGSLYFDPLLPKIEALPSLQECLTAAGINETVDHTAVGDCRQVVRLYRKKYGIEPWE